MSNDKKLSAGCVILAAGDSKRFGKNKLTAVFNGKPIIRHVFDIVPKAGFDAVDTLSASASLKDGRLTVTVVNMDVATSQDVSFTSVGGRLSGKGEMTLMYAEDPQTCNTFEEPYAVKPVTHAVSLSEGSVITLPPACIAQINLKLGEE